MSLQKQSVSINFSQGLSTKEDPFQIPIGRFEELENSVFDTLGRLTKRNGFPQLSTLPNNTNTYLTTYGGNLTALGTNLYAYSQGAQSWVNKGVFTPVQVSAQSLVRNSVNQIQVDAAVSPNGLVCSAYTENLTVGTTSTRAACKFAVSDYSTGQNIIQPTEILSTFGTVSFYPKVFSLSPYFVVVFPSYSGSVYHLQYLAINTNTLNVIGSATDVSTNYLPTQDGSFDGVVANSNLYLSWNGASNTGLQSTYLQSNLTQGNTVTISSSAASLVSVCADISQPTANIYSTAYFTGSSAGFISATNQSLVTLFSSRRFVSSSFSTVINLASSALNNKLTSYFELQNAYTFGSGSGVYSTNFIDKIACTQTGSLSSIGTVARSVGLGSKAFLVGSASYFLSSYQSQYQSSYFLMNSTGMISGKVSYGNGVGFLTKGLPSVTAYSDQYNISYLTKSTIQAANKDTNVAAGTQIAGIYAQSGANLASFKFSSSKLSTAETAGNLNLGGGYLWMYDGNTPVEQNFFVYPEPLGLSGVGSASGQMAAQTYYYQATYEWSDNQGNLFRSAPSVPLSIVVGSGTSAVNVHFPTLRLTNKILSPPKLVLYRWSTAQQTYYQTTSVAVPVLNDMTVDTIDILDTNADATILGNNIIYTNGGALENANGPASDALTLFDNRLWQIDAENPNSLWYSKEVVQATPVEMSQGLTFYVPPTTSTKISTGPMRCIAPMDDKLIIFKKNALYFINGIGPDSTGANNQYSQPTFITATVGSENQNSIVFIPSGLMFQSDKGIWLLGRDLSTQYIGKDVEVFNGDTVLSATPIPGTNQVRFTLSSGTTLIYDYFVNQWGTFTGIPGISSTVYQNMHTYIDSYGRVFQESDGTYLDGTSPVLMSFKTGWLNLAGLQGYKRLYKMFLLGQYKSPHILTIGLAYDYDDSILQQSTIVPTNYSGTWGSGSFWGSVTTWGGSTNREQWQVNFERQQCQSFQISFNEYYDSSLGVAAGAGLTMSGMSIVAGIKGDYPRNISKSNKVG